MTTDSFVVRAVVAFLGLAVLAGMAIGAVLALDERAVPDFIVATTSAAIGALGALLARTSTNDTSTPVHITNAAVDPVPVDPQPDPPRKAAARKR